MAWEETCLLSIEGSRTIVHCTVQSCSLLFVFCYAFGGSYLFVSIPSSPLCSFSCSKPFRTRETTISHCCQLILSYLRPRKSPLGGVSMMSPGTLLCCIAVLAICCPREDLKWHLPALISKVLELLSNLISWYSLKSTSVYKHMIPQASVLLPVWGCIKCRIKEISPQACLHIQFFFKFSS